MTNTSKLSPAPWTAKQWQRGTYRYCWEVRDAANKVVVDLATESDAKAIAVLPELIEAARKIQTAIGLYCCECHITESDLNWDCPELLDAVNNLGAALRRLVG